MKVDAGTAFESVAIGYEPIELPHTLPGNKMVEVEGIEPSVFTTRELIYSQLQHYPTAALLPENGRNDSCKDNPDKPCQTTHHFGYDLVLYLTP